MNNHPIPVAVRSNSLGEEKHRAEQQGKNLSLTFKRIQEDREELKKFGMIITISFADPVLQAAWHCFDNGAYITEVPMMKLLEETG